MPSGGARLNSGPPPDPNALRRDRPSDKDGWTTLPATYEGEVPNWPLLSAVRGLKGGAEASNAVAAQEGDLWRKLWRTPQANIWATNPGTVVEVALYCRQVALAAHGRAMDAAEARQWSDRLGLNPAAMLRMRWRVEGAQGAVKTSTGTRTADPSRQSARDRLKLMDGGVGA